jgi:hypothetical protein
MEWYEILGMSLAVWLVISVALALMLGRAVCSGSSDGVDLDDRRGA